MINYLKQNSKRQRESLRLHGGGHALPVAVGRPVWIIFPHLRKCYLKEMVLFLSLGKDQTPKIHLLLLCVFHRFIGDVLWFTLIRIYPETRLCFSNTDFANTIPTALRDLVSGLHFIHRPVAQINLKRVVISYA